MHDDQTARMAIRSTTTDAADRRDVRSPTDRGTTRRVGDASSLVVAVVLNADGVRFSAVAESRDAAHRRVAAYVERRLDVHLWPDDAEHVRALLDAGDHDAAVEHYFERVGDRWDDEWLVTAPVADEGDVPPDADPAAFAADVGAAPAAVMP